MYKPAGIIPLPNVYTRSMRSRIIMYFKVPIWICMYSSNWYFGIL